MSVAQLNRSTSFFGVNRSSAVTGNHVLRKCALSVFLIGFMLPGTAVLAENEISAANQSKQITEALSNKQNALLQRTDFSKYSAELKSLYHDSHKALLWLTSDQLDAALDLLLHADNQGLNPADYDAQALHKALKPENGTLPQDAQKLAGYDTALSAALLQFLHDLHEGRIQPQQLNYPGSFGNRSLKNAASTIQQALELHQIAQLPQLVEPKIRQYQQLKQNLTTLLQLAPEKPFSTLHIEKSVHPGETFDQLALLKSRLIEIAESPTDIPVNNDLYEGALVEAVKSFQEKSGLQADGVIGKETLALLNQTRVEKIRQIELAMERLRWLPDNLDQGPMIIVNIPAFQLWAFNASNDNQVLNMRVIVGKAQQNQTPMLIEDMQYLEFMPYWNIPKSILDKEIVPKLADDISYLQDQDIELVQRLADEEEGETQDIVTELRQGKLRARQRPGKKNPLGKVKFVFPNKEDVYLHDTPSHGLFDRSRRDFSHGCVRVSEADKLAEFVLSRQSGWDQAAIQKAMSGDKTQRVRLKQSIPVLFFYSTSFVDHDNRLHFYRDIYGHDAELQRALVEKRSNAKKINENLVTSKNLSAG